MEGGSESPPPGEGGGAIVRTPNTPLLSLPEQFVAMLLEVEAERQQDRRVIQDLRAQVAAMQAALEAAQPPGGRGPPDPSRPAFTGRGVEGRIAQLQLHGLQAGPLVRRPRSSQPDAQASVLALVPTPPWTPTATAAAFPSPHLHTPVEGTSLQVLPAGAGRAGSGKSASAALPPVQPRSPEAHQPKPQPAPMPDAVQT